MAKSLITCHVLDSSVGKPAEGVEVCLQEYCVDLTESTSNTFGPIARGQTDSNGRCLDLLIPPNSAEPEKHTTTLKAGGLYKMIFMTKQYFEGTGRKAFYPWVEITFEIENPKEHYHIPLLISPYSYTTYRGS